ncbi:MAG: cytochrome c oxidase assembly protein [Pseudomonadota bacterium]|jgi:putative membrane protein
MPAPDAATVAARTSWDPYCGAGPAPAELLARWNLDPWLLFPLAIGVVGYAGARRVGGADDRLAFAAMAVLAIAFVSPLCALSSALFSARVLHHALLVTIAAPLLAFALPAGRGRPRLALTTAAHALVLWVWHAPGPYAWALSHDGAYWLMQATLLGSAFLFWRSIRLSDSLAAAAALLATMVQMGLLGALITFAASPLYAPHLATTVPWGLRPLQDQQLAGLIMWAPMAGAYLAAALAIVGRSLSPSRAANAT